MNFFCTKKHYDKWINNITADKNSIFCLDPLEALEVANMIFNVEDI